MIYLKGFLKLKSNYCSFQKFFQKGDPLKHKNYSKSLIYTNSEFFRFFINY